MTTPPPPVVPGWTLTPPSNLHDIEQKLVKNGDPGDALVRIFQYVVERRASMNDEGQEKSLMASGGRHIRGGGVGPAARGEFPTAPPASAVRAARGGVPAWSEWDVGESSRFMP